MQALQVITKNTFLTRWCAPALLLLALSASTPKPVSADEGAPSIETTPDEQAIISKFLGKSEERQSDKKAAFIALSGGGGLLSGGDYNKFQGYVSDNTFRTDGGTSIMESLANSRELGFSLGMMTGAKTAASLSFNYWLKNGSAYTGDFALALAPAGLQNDFTLRSEMTVYGISGGLDYFLMNAPNDKGVLGGLSLSMGGEVGYYFTNWDLWEGNGNINLSTSQFEQIGGAVKDQAPGFSMSVNAAYPMGFWKSAIGLEFAYTYLKFDNVHWTNSDGEEIFVTYSPSSSDQVQLDFSGLRAKLELRKYMSW